MAEKDKKVIIEKTVKDLLENLKIKARVKIEEKEEAFFINLEVDEPGLLIGFHGENLASIQRILSLMVFRKVGQWSRIIVDVAGYRQQRREALEKMAFSAAQKVVFTGEPYSLPPLRPFERRIIHLTLANHPEVETESEGEEDERRVVVKLR